MVEDKGLVDARAKKKKAHDTYMQTVREEAKILSSELEAPSLALLDKMVKSKVKHYFNEFEIGGVTYNIRLARKKQQPFKTELKK